MLKQYYPTFKQLLEDQIQLQGKYFEKYTTVNSQQQNNAIIYTQVELLMDFLCHIIKLQQQLQQNSTIQNDLDKYIIQTSQTQSKAIDTIEFEKQKQKEQIQELMQQNNTQSLQVIDMNKRIITFADQQNRSNERKQELVDEIEKLKIRVKENEQLKIEKEHDFQHQINQLQNQINAYKIQFEEISERQVLNSNMYEQQRIQTIHDLEDKKKQIQQKQEQINKLITEKNLLLQSSHQQKCDLDNMTTVHKQLKQSFERSILEQKQQLQQQYEQYNGEKLTLYMAEKQRLENEVLELNNRIETAEKQISLQNQKLVVIDKLILDNKQLHHENGQNANFIKYLNVEIDKQKSLNIDKTELFSKINYLEGELKSCRKENQYVREQNALLQQEPVQSARTKSRKSVIGGTTTSNSHNSQQLQHSPIMQYLQSNSNRIEQTPQVLSQSYLSDKYNSQLNQLSKKYLAWRK